MTGSLSPLPPHHRVGSAVEEDAAATARPLRISTWWSFLHLATLNAFVFAQPLLDRLQRNTGYLAQERITPAAMVLVLAAILVGPPLFWLVLRRLGAFCRPARADLVHLGAVFTYAALAILITLCGVLEIHHVKQWGIPGLFVVALSVGGAWLLTRCYRSRRWMRSTVSAASIGIILFPVMFWRSKPISETLFPPSTSTKPALHADNPVPVVMVVFDGLAGMALLDETHHIDPVRYPNFARLSETSTWYRNASTVHPRTDNAVPALLTGRYPVQERQPTEQQHPDNLFTFLLRTGQYELTVFEPYTRLCPQRLRDRPHSSSTVGKARDVLTALGAVYLNTTLPADIPVPLPRIPRAWFRLPDHLDVDTSLRGGLMVYNWDSDRPIQIDHFLNGLNEVGRPGFHYLHVMLPHYPWCYFPSGRRYVDSITSADYPQGTYGEFGEDWGHDPLAPENAWRRYLLQLQYADRQLGRILDQLGSCGQWDRCLMIVTADHGESFLPNHSRRTPTPETLPDLLSVPLFIKQPHQTQGWPSDRNVELIDVLPTLADVLDLELPVPVDGDSLLVESGRARLRKTIYVGGKPIVVDGDFPQRFSYVDRMVQTFGTGSGNDRLQTCSIHPELVGRALSELRVAEGDDSALQLQLQWGGHAPSASPPDPQVVPCLFEGTIENVGSRQLPVLLAVSVNGRIAGVTRTLTNPEYTSAWSLLVPETTFQAAGNDVQMGSVPDTGSVRDTEHDTDIRIFELQENSDGPVLVPCRF